MKAANIQNKNKKKNKSFISRYFFSTNIRSFVGHSPSFFFFFFFFDAFPVLLRIFATTNELTNIDIYLLFGKLAMAQSVESRPEKKMSANRSKEIYI